MTDKLELHIEYLEREDKECPYMVVPAFPIAGDFIRTKLGEYKIERIVMNDNIPDSIQVSNYTAVVSPV